MSEERVIHIADLRQIERGLSVMVAGLDQVRVDVSLVGSEVQSTRADLDRLWTEFQAFLEADRKAKQLQLAETRIVKVRQELENRFGHYGEVRRRTTGILQAADVRLVRQETIKSATENLMLAAPGYWLAPALVALSAWLSDDAELAQRAAMEGAQRDDEKTSLFFALVCRRANRLSASGVWLDRFFAMQDPNLVDREVVVLIDAVASGVFGADVRNRCRVRFDEWTTRLSEQAGFIEGQREQWRKALVSRNVTRNSSKFEYLARYSSTWTQLEDTLHGAMIHSAVLDHFHAVFGRRVTPPANVQVAVDELLNKLVTNFDDEELPLRRDERLFQLIIDMDGDRDAAQNRFELEKQAHVERISFTQLLTNAAMHAESSHASVSTQRFALVLSRQWIAAAHADLAAGNRASVSSAVQVGIAGWSGTTDGSNEAELADSLKVHLQREEDAALEQVTLSPMAWFSLFVGVVSTLLCVALQSLIPLPFLVIGIGWFVISRAGLQKARDQVSAAATQTRISALDVLHGSVAEVVDWRREYTRLDAQAEDVEAFLGALAPHEQIGTSHDTHRNILV